MIFLTWYNKKTSSAHPHPIITFWVLPPRKICECLSYRTRGKKINNMVGFLAQNDMYFFGVKTPSPLRPLLDTKNTIVDQMVCSRSGGSGNSKTQQESTGVGFVQ